MTLLTLATHNLPGTLAPSRRRTILGRLAERAHIIALQEARWLVPDDVPAGWGAARGADPALTVLYRGDRFTRTGILERRAYPATPVGEWGAGPDTLAAGWDFGVRLLDHDTMSPQHPTGQHLWVIDAHLAPSVQKARPADPDDAANREMRRRLHNAEVEQLVIMADMVAWVGEPCLVAGDFNATPDSPLLIPMRAAFDGYATRPTHGDRAIDYIWYRGATLSRTVELSTASDHDALIATFTI